MRLSRPLVCALVGGAEAKSILKDALYLNMYIHFASIFVFCLFAQYSTHLHLHELTTTEVIRGKVDLHEGDTKQESLESMHSKRTQSITGLYKRVAFIS